MNDEQQPLENPTETQPATESPNQTRHTDEIDVESALAAVASLHELIREDEPEDEPLTEPDEAEWEALDEDEVELAETEAEDITEYVEIEEIVPLTSDFPHPPHSALHRGQAASIIPALLLIGGGGALTLLLTTTPNLIFNPALIAVLTMGGIGLALVSYWFSSTRWSSGSFFVGMALLLLGGTAVYLILPTNLTFVQGWPLLLTAIGTAFVLTDITNPSAQRLWLVGLLLAFAGFAGVIVTGQFLDSAILQMLRSWWPVPLGLVAIVLLVPIFRRDG